MQSVLIWFALAFFVLICKHMKLFYPSYCLLSWADFNASSLFYFILFFCFCFFFFFIGRYNRTTVTCKTPIRTHTWNCTRNLLLSSQEQHDLSLFLYGFLLLWPQIVVCVAHCETEEVHPWNNTNSSEGGVLLYFLLGGFFPSERRNCSLLSSTSLFQRIPFF